MINITRGNQGQHAWNRVISFIGAIAMSLAFVKEAATNSLEWLDYIGYSIGMTVMYSPVLAVKLLQAWRQTSRTSSSEITTKFETHTNPLKSEIKERAD